MRLLKRVVKWLAGLAVVLVLIIAIGGFLLVRAFVEPDAAAFGTVKDEAAAANLKGEHFRPADEGYFAAMDKGLLLPPATGQDYPAEILEIADLTGLPPEDVRNAAIRGQNAWIVWTGGNDRFWDFAAANTVGSFDLLKTISSHPSQYYSRDNRFRWLGLINEPCFSRPTEPDGDHFGLWLDQRDSGCPDDPFADEAKYAGVAVGARGKTQPVGSYYGEPTGVIGLRLFPNPDFDEAAKESWDPVRYYTDPDYYNDGKLVRPYRVGMSCAFCHVGPNPINPPQNPEAPEWEELTSNPGAQYFWVERIFFWNTRPRSEPGAPAPNEANFLFQLFHTNPPGSLDTSLVSSDYMNNPRTMNAVYEVGARLQIAARLGTEQLQGGEKDNRQLQDFPQTAALADLYDATKGTVASMRVLKDGADSVGALGALNRVYLNIGLFSEEWLLHFRPFLGGQKISPILIADAQKNSAYWQATENMTADMAIFFLVTARADLLADAPGGPDLLDARDPAGVARGKEVFAENCAACHSSRQPAPPAESGVDQGICEGGGAGPHYRECWDRYRTWTLTDDYKAQMRAIVAEPDFTAANYFSTERRVPIDELGTNTCSAIATNGLRGDIWDNFTSDSYKSLPPPGPVTVHHPVSGAASSFQSPGNGRGYLRPASLVSLWSTAPYLLNNSVGYDGYSGSSYSGDQSASCPAADIRDPDMPCVENRLYQFDKSIRQMLWPETRRRDTLTTEPVPGYIYRLSAPACLIVPKGFAPDPIRNNARLLSRVAPWLVSPDGTVRVGPFPKDFPINALVNTKLLPDNDEPEMLTHLLNMAKASPTLLGAVRQLGGRCSPEELADPAVQADAERIVRETGLVDTLVGLSKCPDYVVNKGHEFGADLSDTDKEALISFLMEL
ncbi:cytochrome c [Paracoccus caeni]|uniref:Cytochrome c n=1 Tax=Paracoccus caeni TaxID=657651 RepID=A0A934VTS3_9RHOB|nr:cytochrome c [Paracoccus caeni]MBK4215041.1 cytochrome c [Paracoccus caeni]